MFHVNGSDLLTSFISEPLSNQMFWCFLLLRIGLAYQLLWGMTFPLLGRQNMPHLCHLGVFCDHEVQRNFIVTVQYMFNNFLFECWFYSYSSWCTVTPCGCTYTSDVGTLTFHGVVIGEAFSVSFYVGTYIYSHHTRVWNPSFASWYLMQNKNFSVCYLKWNYPRRGVPRHHLTEIERNFMSKSKLNSGKLLGQKYTLMLQKWMNFVLLIFFINIFIWIERIGNLSFVCAKWPTCKIYGEAKEPENGVKTAGSRSTLVIHGGGGGVVP